MNRNTEYFSQLSWFESWRVAEARIMVVGCGALGNEVLKSLAMFGVGELFIVDIDCVEDSNLTRSVLFDADDAKSKRRKVEAAKRGVERINPDIRVTPIFGDIATEVGVGLIASMDVVVGCVDNRWARYCINRLAFRAGVAWVDGGIDGLEGTARLFEYGYNCYGCNLGEQGLREMAQRVSCSSIVRRNSEEGRVATTPIVASVIGAVQAQEAMKILHRDIVESGQFTTLRGKMFYYEGEHLTSRIVEFEGYDDDCPLHERWDGVIKSDITIDSRVGDVLHKCGEILDDKQVSITLLNHAFVEYLESRWEHWSTREVLLPSYKIESYIEQDEELRGVLNSDIFQMEWRTIGPDFPFMELTLAQLGIPDWDILQFSTQSGVRYVELAKRETKE